MAFSDFTCANVLHNSTVTVPVGAGSEPACYSDASDATYVDLNTAGAPFQTLEDYDVWGMGSLPANAIVTQPEVHIRTTRGVSNTVFGIPLIATPKPQFQSPSAPIQVARCDTTLSENAFAWGSIIPADFPTWHDIGVLYNMSWVYNTGNGYTNLTWEQMDLSTVVLRLEWYAPTGSAVRVSKMWVRLYYETPPVVSGITEDGLSAGTITTTTAPTVRWTYTDADGSPQQIFRGIVVKNTAHDVAGRLAGATNFDPESASPKDFDTGFTYSNNNVFTVGPYGLDNLGTYYAYVRAWAPAVQSVPQYSTYAHGAAFLISCTPPNVPTINAYADNDNSKIDVDIVAGNWPTGTPFPYRLDVKRSVDPTLPWQPMRNGTNVTTMSGLQTGSTSGNQIDTPDSVALSAATDIDVRVCFALLAPPNANYLLSKADISASSWFFRIDNTNHPIFEWFSTGPTIHTATCPVALPLPPIRTPIWLRAKLNSTSNWNVQFYYSMDSVDTNPNEVVWTLLGTFTGTGVATILDTATVLVINGVPGGFATNFRIYYAELRDSTGASVANPDFRGLTLGSKTFVDAIGNTWTINAFSTNETVPFWVLHDYEVKPGQVANYYAQTSTVSAGVPIAGAWQPVIGTQTTALNKRWWFKVVEVPELNAQFDLYPGSWNAHRPADSAAFSALGRTNKVVSSDGVRGREQTLKVECITDAELDALSAIYEAQQTVLVMNDVEERYMFFTDWKDDRGGMSNKYTTVDLIAYEVDRPIIR